MSRSADLMTRLATGILLLTAVGILAHVPSLSGAERAIHADVAATIDPAARYLFHMHGRAVEVQG